MARLKTGLAYYNAETDRFQDIRIKRLKKDRGCIGYAVYEYILNEIYRVEGSILVWDESTAFDVAEYWGLKETQVNDVVDYCCAVGLFDKELLSSVGVLSSSSIQSRYVEMCIRAKRKGIRIREDCNVLPEESQIVLEEYAKTHEDCNKVKKSKVNNSLSSARAHVGGLFPPDEVFEKTLDECYMELKSNQSWMETVCMNTRRAFPNITPAFTPEVFHEYLERFFMKLQNEGEIRKAPKDAMTYFSRWLEYELKKQKDGQKQSNKTVRGAGAVSGNTARDTANRAECINTQAANLEEFINGLSIGK